MSQSMKIGVENLYQFFASKCHFLIVFEIFSETFSRGMVVEQPEEFNVIHCFIPFLFSYFLIWKNK